MPILETKIWPGGSTPIARIEVWQDGSAGYYVCLDIDNDSFVLMPQRCQAPCNGGHEYERKSSAMRAAKRIAKKLGLEIVAND